MLRTARLATDVLTRSLLTSFPGFAAPPCALPPE
jgi:hypothetical protein